MRTCASWRTRRPCLVPGWCTRPRQVAPGEALPLLADGAVDPRQTALLETAPPALSAPADPAAEAVRLIQDAPDRLELDVRADVPGAAGAERGLGSGLECHRQWRPSPGLGWPTTLLRAVPIPPGQHTVVLSYDPPCCALGMAITAITLALVAVAIVAGEREERL